MRDEKVHKLLASAGRIALRAVIIYAVIVALAAMLQSRLVYFPTSQWETTPDAIGLRHEDVTLTAADGVKLSAWFVPAARAKGAVLFCHGNGGNISHRLETIATWNGLGADVLIFDYRGYGRSEGKPTEAGTYLDAVAAWDWLLQRRGGEPNGVIVHGRSLGGAVAAHLARSRRPAGLIVESSFSSIADLGAELYWFLPVRWLCRFDYATAEYVKGVTCPLLVVHSRDDDMIPLRHGRRIFAAATQPKEFLEIHGSHNGGFIESMDAYEPALRRFLAGALKRGGS